MVGLLYSVIFVYVSALNPMTFLQGHIDTGKWDAKQIDHLLREASSLSTQDRIAYLSKAMLGVRYNDKTLIGDITTKEVLVINLREVDCFTFIDYVEAMRLSRDFNEFKDNLISVRYRLRDIDFIARKHFFSDWVNLLPSSVYDVTKEVGGIEARFVWKTLNIKNDKSNYLKGLAPVERQIWYIPSSRLTREIVGRLQTGDYIGIYTRQSGLDVSHVGIFIREERGRLIFRHASSIKGRVVDQDFMGYVSKTAGIVVLRPMD